MCELPTLLICHVIDWTARKRKATFRKEQQHQHQQHSLVPCSCFTVTATLTPNAASRIERRRVRWAKGGDGSKDRHSGFGGKRPH